MKEDKIQEEEIKQDEIKEAIINELTQLFKSFIDRGFPTVEILGVSVYYSLYNLYSIAPKRQYATALLDNTLSIVLSELDKQSDLENIEKK